MHLPQDWSWRLHPVLSCPLGSEQINRNAVLRQMRLDVAIETTQIGQNIMQKAVVMLDKRTLLAIINRYIHSAESAPLVLAFLVVGHK
jgi:hypothetical protein